MRIIVTGAKGYLSSKIVQYFRSQNSYEIQQISVRSDVEPALVQGVDAVIHVAGLTPRKGINDEEFYAVNTERTRQLFECCEKAGVQHFIYISTMAVYGDTLRTIGDNPITLSSACANPAAYGNSKLKAEAAIRELAKHTKWTVLRVPSLYDENRLNYFDMYKMIAEHMPVLPRMTFCTRRSLLNIDNLCELLLKVVQNTEEAFVGKILLPCDAYMPDVNDLLGKVCKEKGLKRLFIPMNAALAKACYRFVPQLLSLSMNAYYGDADCYKLSKYSIDDVALYTHKEQSE